MKALRVLFLAVLVALAATACSNKNDKLLDQYEKAIQAGDYEKASEYVQQIDETKLTSAQRTRLINIATQQASKSMKELEKLSDDLDREMADLDDDMDDLDDDLDDLFDED